VAVSAIEGRDEAAAHRFVEQFASLLIDAGFQRMPARVFSAILASESGRMTAAELADTLQASPAAISGAVRWLTHFELAVRTREPGSRRDHYTVLDDTWSEAMMGRDKLLAAWSDSLRQGIRAVGPDTAAGRRLSHSLDFTEFMTEELTGLAERWRKHVAEHS
jgi:DNA-binding transcriptional regulator GbsR (MarR family)